MCHFLLDTWMPLYTCMPSIGFILDSNMQICSQNLIMLLKMLCHYKFIEHLICLDICLLIFDWCSQSLMNNMFICHSGSWPAKLPAAPGLCVSVCGAWWDRCLHLPAMESHPILFAHTHLPLHPALLSCWILWHEADGQHLPVAPCCTNLRNHPGTRHHQSFLQANLLHKEVRSMLRCHIPLLLHCWWGGAKFMGCISCQFKIITLIIGITCLNNSGVNSDKPAMRLRAWGMLRSLCPTLRVSCQLLKKVLSRYNAQT